MTAHYLNQEKTHVVITEGDVVRTIPVDHEQYQKLLDGGVMISDYQPPVEQVQAAFTAAIQQHLDTWAQSRGYDGILSACTYATSKLPRFKAEGQAAVNARDAVWSAAYALVEEVQAGTKPMPTLDDVIATLPALSWPEVPA